MGSDKRLMAVVPSFQEFQRIFDILAPDGVDVQQASCLLEAVLAHAHAQRAMLAQARQDGTNDLAMTNAGPVILYDIDSFTSNLNGWRGALRQLLNLHHDTRVIFTSRLADEDMWIEVLATGGHDLLSKPFSDSELRQAVRRALGGKALATAA
jgi:FixJ family two-component response regulator